jgi:hypothetical protein
VWIWCKYKTECVPFKVRAFIDGNAVAATDYQTRSEDGVAYTADVAGIEVDPTVRRHRFRLPMQDQFCTDLALEFYSSEAGQPWEINRIKIMWDWDPATGVPPDQ